VSECSIDGRPADSAFLCRGCLDALKAELRSVAWLVEQLGITLTRQARVGQRNGPRSAETPLPFHLRASVDLETLRDGLGMWALAVAERRGVALDAAATPAAFAAWLLRWAGEVAQHPDAAELHGDVLAMTEAARRTIDLPPQRHYCGPCDLCGEDLYVGQLAKVVTCRVEGCEFSADVAERRTWLLEHAVDQLRTAAELSRELPWIGGVTIDRKLINQWAVRGRITKFLPHPRDPHGRARFRLGEVLERARETVMERSARVAG
jgi:hypothetical protein